MLIIANGRTMVFGDLNVNGFDLKRAHFTAPQLTENKNIKIKLCL